MRVISIDPGTKNLAVCAVDFVGEEPPKIAAWATTALDGSDAAGVASTMARLFGGGDDAGLADLRPEVVIEKQPPKNAKMRTLQCYAEMYWVLRGAVRVVVQDARAKLNWAATTRHWPTREIPTWSYSERKKLSVEVARSWLAAGADEGPWREAFEASKKKDDLADALLQALAYVGMVRRVLADGGSPKKQAKAIVARKPSAAAAASGKFTRNGVKWLLLRALGARDGDAATLEDVLTQRGAETTKLRKSVLKNFGSYEACARDCFSK